MQRNELYPGLRVEDAYNNEYFVVSTATWVQSKYSFSPFTKYEFMGDEYNVHGEIAPRGRYVLVRNIAKGHGVLKRPSDLSPIGTYEAERFANYVYMSNHKIRQIERKAVADSKLRAYWGDAYDTIVTKFNLDFDHWNWDSRVDVAIEYGKVHYAATR